MTYDQLLITTKALLAILFTLFVLFLVYMNGKPSTLHLIKKVDLMEKENSLLKDSIKLITKLVEAKDVSIGIQNEIIETLQDKNILLEESIKNNYEKEHVT